jgi:hypothetical protein
MAAVIYNNDDFHHSLKHGNLFHANNLLIDKFLISTNLNKTYLSIQYLPSILLLNPLGIKKKVILKRD